MHFDFVETKSDSSFYILVGRPVFRFVNNPDGGLYTTINHTDGSKMDVVRQLIDQLGFCILRKKNVLILSLLIDPYFDELCEYVRNTPSLKPYKKHMLKKYIFQHLADDITAKIYHEGFCEGAPIYNAKKMDVRSKEMLELLSDV